MDFVTGSVAIGTFLEASDATLLSTHGITGILCLVRDRMREPAPPGLEKDSWPLEDGAGNTRSDIDGALRKLDRLLTRHPRVLVHCHAGKSRSCGLVALWLARHESLSIEEAVARVAAKRPVLWIAPDLLETLAGFARGDR